MAVSGLRDLLAWVCGGGHEVGRARQSCSGGPVPRSGLGVHVGGAEAWRSDVNRSGFGGGIDPTKGWSHVGTAEVSA